MKHFRHLQVWEKYHELTLTVYSVTKAFPKEELFGLTSQVRPASASIPTNIAEGCGRGSDADFSRFLQVAFGSACEVEYQLQLARDLRYIDNGTYGALNGDLLSVKKMLSLLIMKIKADR